MMQSIRHRQSSLLQHPLSDVARQRHAGFTLVELLVVISIIALLMAILLPALNKVTLQAQRLRNMNNQRQIVQAFSEFALDNDNKYPLSSCTSGSNLHWGWQEPTMITSYLLRPGSPHRSLSASLYDYIQNSDIMSCPCAPETYKYLQDAWEAGDAWDNPDTVGIVPDPVSGTYCFYSNYTGYLPASGKLFKGPKVLMGGHGQSEVLVSDYFGCGHWRSPYSYGSCEPMPHATITPGSDVSSAYWSVPKDSMDLQALSMRLHAGFVDGHVESYRPTETVRMQVSITSDGRTPYPPGVGPGDFMLPRTALQ